MAYDDLEPSQRRSLVRAIRDGLIAKNVGTVTLNDPLGGSAAARAHMDAAWIFDSGWANRTEAGWSVDIDTYLIQPWPRKR
ncbi:MULTISPECIES: hypothetical protein [Actinomycetes]|uniref:hypothetical protein n=1 Tax=Actinomycetes TaxID=1760 RepID=UPI0010A79C2A|nr:MULTISPECIES: hypothetical protein [Actinomycetes]